MFIIQFDAMESIVVRVPRPTDKEIYPHPFRLLDGDGNLMFCGRSDENGTFEAQDEFGGPYGVVSTQYVDQYGEWVEL